MADHAPLQARHVIVHGRVQGVGFRTWVRGEALSRGLAGWVRNRRDGTVEAVIAGPPDPVAAREEVLRHGPPAAHVSHIDTADWTGKVPTDFDLRPTD